MTGGFKRPRPWLLALAGFLALQALLLGRFIGRESRPPAWDQANHLDVALQYHDALASGRWSEALTLAPKHYIPPFPPLYHLSISWAYSTAHPARNALWSNLFYMAALALCLHLLAARRGREDAAAAGAIAFACAPVIQWLLYTQLIDLALCAAAAAAYLAWIRSEGFSRRGASLGFGLAFAAGMLLKWSFFSYMLPALWSAARACRDRRSRSNALLAAAVAAALASPWYLIRLPLILQRLVQASADRAVPFWEGAAALLYIRQLPDTLGLFFSLAALTALLLLRRDKAARPLIACVLCSYVFWTLVPNRQMRYLLPGLVPLGALLAWGIPRPALWTIAALQLTGAINRPLGLFGPLRVPLPGAPYQAFQTEPPRREDWPLREIVEEAASLGGLSVVADHERLNPLNLLWTARVLGRDVSIEIARNKLWELAPALLLKRYDMGHAEFITGLSPIREAVLRPDGGIARGFALKERWRLPDGDEALLYARRSPVAEPFRGSRRVRAAAWTTPLFSFPDARLELGKWDWKRGVYDRVRLSSSRAELRGGIPLSDVRLELTGGLLMPDGPPSSPENLRLLRLERLRVLSARVDAASLRRVLERRGVRIDSLSFQDEIAVAGAFKRLPFEATVGVRCAAAPDGGAILVSLERLKLLSIPIPARGMPLLKATPSPGAITVETPYWAGLKRRLPFELAVSGCRAEGDSLVVH